MITSYNVITLKVGTQVKREREREREVDNGKGMKEERTSTKSWGPR